MNAKERLDLIRLKAELATMQARLTDLIRSNIALATTVDALLTSLPPAQADNHNAACSLELRLLDASALCERCGRPAGEHAQYTGAEP